MSRFLDLAHRPHDEADPHAADRLLPSIVKISTFQMWNRGDPIPRRGVFVLLGVATWSGYDMQLLDTLQEIMAGKRRDWTIGIFNAGILTGQEALREYVPDAPFVFHTPVVGVWRDGFLTDRAEGSTARDLVARMFGSSSDDVIAAVDQARAARTA
jgi:hypothetical protein